MVQRSTEMSLTKDDLEVKIGQISSASFKNEAERASARLVLQKALARVETPWEKATDVIWSQVRLLHLQYQTKQY